MTMPEIIYEEMPTRWILKEFLDQNGITAYALAKETGIALNNIYNVCDPQTIPRKKNLDKIILGLRELTNKKVDISDLLVWEESDA